MVCKRASMDFRVILEQALPCGLCVGVHIPPGDDAITPAVLARLHPDEAAHARTLHPRRQPSWVAGRLALRQALTRLGHSAGPILADDRGAPVLPGGVRGSISHKRAVAVGLAASTLEWSIGVDIEQRHLGRQDISRYVLTEAEQAELAGLSAQARGQAVMLRFSIKESIYKAVDPHVRRFVGFREVDVTPLPDGRVEVAAHLAQGEVFTIDAWWSVEGEHVLTCARAQPRGSPLVAD